jgi:ATP-dependent Clp protease ATP-binding subunit ClpA
MFERFTGQARAAVSRAQQEARQLRNPYIGPEHLLLGMLDDVDGAGAGSELLAERGMTAEAVRRQLHDPNASRLDLDAEALNTLGIDLEQVRRVVEEQFGPGALARNAKPMPTGHLCLTKRSKKVLELAVRAAQSTGSDTISSAHLLLGLIQDVDGPAAQLIRESGVDLDALAADARARANDRAA